MDDLTEPVTAEVTVTSPWSVAEGALELTNLSQGAGSYFWSFGGGANSTEFEPEFAYTEGGAYTIYLTANSLDGLCSDQFGAEVEVLRVGRVLIVIDLCQCNQVQYKRRSYVTTI
jgi:PKD repeat protein